MLYNPYKSGIGIDFSPGCSLSVSVGNYRDIGRRSDGTATLVAQGRGRETSRDTYCTTGAAPYRGRRDVRC